MVLQMIRQQQVKPDSVISNHHDVKFQLPGQILIIVSMYQQLLWSNLVSTITLGTVIY